MRQMTLPQVCHPPAGWGNLREGSGRGEIDMAAKRVLYSAYPATLGNVRTFEHVSIPAQWTSSEEEEG